MLAFAFAALVGVFTGPVPAVVLPDIRVSEESVRSEWGVCKGE